MKATLLLVAALTTVSASAGDSRIPLVRPEGSGLTLVRLSSQNEHFAEFRGVTVVSGTLYAYWHSTGSSPVEFRLIPDKTSAARLPHFARYKVAWIGVKNGPAALEMSLSKAQYRAVMAKEGPVARVHGTWEITGFAVGIECDGPYAHATVVRVIPAVQVAGVRAPETC